MTKINLREIMKNKSTETIKDIQNYHACFHGDCPHDKQIFCMDAVVEAGYTAALNDLQGKVDGLLDALEEAVESYPKDLRHHTKAYKAIAEFKNGEVK
jgi:histone acetyltransferase (RNA polymerase elongator complex component)